MCIADEVQAGFGRTGSHYWGFETQGVQPDIVVMAKGIASGFPFSALGTRREIDDRWPTGSHGGTYGGGNAIPKVGSPELGRVGWVVTSIGYTNFRAVAQQPTRKRQSCVAKPKH